MMPLSRRAVPQLEVRIARQRRAGEQIEQRLADVCGGGPAPQHLVLWKMRLEFDRVGAGRRRRIHQLRGQRRVAVVVDAGLGNDEARLAFADLPAGDGDVRRVRHHVLTVVPRRLSGP